MSAKLVPFEIPFSYSWATGRRTKLVDRIFYRFILEEKFLKLNLTPRFWAGCLCSSLFFVSFLLIKNEYSDLFVLSKQQSRLIVTEYFIFKWKNQKSLCFFLHPLAVRQSLIFHTLSAVAHISWKLFQMFASRNFNTYLSLHGCGFLSIFGQINIRIIAHKRFIISHLLSAKFN